MPEQQTVKRKEQFYDEVFISQFCLGEKCRICGDQAAHKVEEVVPGDEQKGTHSFPDDEIRLILRHPFSAYLCHVHFVLVMGPAAA